MRFVNYLLSAVFLTFAVVQINDPDSILWILIYIVPAVIASAFPYKKPNRMLLGILALAYLSAALVLFPASITEWIDAEEQAQSLNMTLPGIEESRESMGLFLCFATMTYYWFKARKKSAG